MLRTYIVLLCAAMAWALGCEVDQPVGLELGNSGPIPDSSITTNSKINDWHGPAQGRLNNYRKKPGATDGAGAWCANKWDNVTYRYLQFDLGTERKIGRIATQGRNTTYAQYVTSYHISYSTAGDFFSGIQNGNTLKSFTGNTDKNSIVYNDLPSTARKPLEARYIRILPQDFYGNICMRVEFYECVEPTTQPPVSTTAPPTCPAGYRFAADNTTCIDINECAENTDNCDQNCHNTNGSYTCSCNAGYTLRGDGRTCQDNDECTLNTDNCDQNCHNTGGSYTCSCNAGYTLQGDGRTCQDNDECTRKTDNCDQNCHNTDGSYTCSCDSGYTLQGDGRTCQDNDECTLNTDNCDQNCHNTGGSYTCSCNAGYTLQGDGRTCQDIDECATGTDNCDNSSTTCFNYEGSFSCPCLSGFERGVLYFRCNDIDECTRNTDQCDTFSTTCVNTAGSYQCDCQNGFERDTRYRCTDINECLTNNGGCSDTCVNLNSTYICSCPTGYEVDSSGKICQDKDECKLADGGCEQVCTNTDGSYECSCNSGFKLQSNGLNCEDIDECAEGTDQCDNNSTTCQNSAPGYQCNCKDGYIPIANEDYMCQAKTCPALSESQGTSVSPSRCLEDNKSIVGDVCTFSCQAGYELPSNKNTLACLASGSWSDSEIICQKVSCPSLSAPANGQIFPDSCRTVGNVYEETCHYVCNSGFDLVGTATKTCLSSGQWSSQDEPTCHPAYPDPWITCPGIVSVTLSPGANTADVSALLGSPTSNQPAERITITPEQYNAHKTFPAGTTTLTYTARNPVNKTAQCSVLIGVEDIEKPKVSDCPLEIFEITTTNTLDVSWTPPIFTDNVGVVSVHASQNPGDTFQQGKTNVIYTAKDDANNQETCSFEVNVKKRECPDATPPDNGVLTSCFDFGGARYCNLQCNENKTLFTKVVFAQCTAVTFEWDTPDCVDYTSPAADDSCSIGYVKQTGSFPDNICVKCPTGMFYDVVNATCKNCPVGYISTVEGSLHCEACPANSSTLEEGSKTCTAQCLPGYFSSTGFNLPADLSPCKPCPKSFYQNGTGQDTCSNCPNDTTTISSGSTSSNECGGVPRISDFGPNPTNATENQMTQFECYGSGIPLPTFSIKKVNETSPGFEGPVAFDYIQGPDGNQIGLRYTIIKVTEHDKGAYLCKVENKFGSDTKYITVTVKLDFSIGKRRRRRRRRSLSFLKA